VRNVVLVTVAVTIIKALQIPVVSQFEISAPWESGPLVIGHTDKCDPQIVSNLTARRRLKLF